MHPACERCRGACCEYFQLEIHDSGWPESVIRWLEYHGTKVGQAVRFACACSKLVDGKCSVYETRPAVCVKYPVGGQSCRDSIRARRAAAEADEILKLLE